MILSRARAGAAPARPEPVGRRGKRRSARRFPTFECPAAANGSPDRSRACRLPGKTPRLAPFSGSPRRQPPRGPQRGSRAGVQVARAVPRPLQRVKRSAMAVCHWDKGAIRVPSLLCGAQRGADHSASHRRGTSGQGPKSAAEANRSMPWGWGPRTRRAPRGVLETIRAPQGGCRLGDPAAEAADLPRTGLERGLRRVAPRTPGNHACDQTLHVPR